MVTYVTLIPKREGVYGPLISLLRKIPESRCQSPPFFVSLIPMIELIAFDLDNTVYPESTGLLREIDERIARFIMERLAVDREEAHLIRRRYLDSYGTTAQGLARESKIDPRDFLEYVDKVPSRELLKDVPREPLRQMILGLPQRKAIFTNSTVAHADSVLSILEIDDCFEFVYDLVAMKHLGKPNPEAFKGFLKRAGLPAAKVLFVDDNGYNIAAARELGIHVLMVREFDPPAGVLSPKKEESGLLAGSTFLPDGVETIRNILELPRYLKQLEEDVA